MKKLTTARKPRTSKSIKACSPEAREIFEELIRRDPRCKGLSEKDMDDLLEHGKTNRNKKKNFSVDDFNEEQYTAYGLFCVGEKEIEEELSELREELITWPAWTKERIEAHQKILAKARMVADRG